MKNSIYKSLIKPNKVIKNESLFFKSFEEQKAK